jgi:hypothetical protein
MDLRDAGSAVFGNFGAGCRRNSNSSESIHDSCNDNSNKHRCCRCHHNHPARFVACNRNNNNPAFLGIDNIGSILDVDDNNDHTGAIYGHAVDYLQYSRGE